MKTPPKTPSNTHGGPTIDRAIRRQLLRVLPAEDLTPLLQLVLKLQGTSSHSVRRTSLIRHTAAILDADACVTATLSINSGGTIVNVRGLQVGGTDTRLPAAEVVRRLTPSGLAFDPLLATLIASALRDRTRPTTATAATLGLHDSWRDTPPLRDLWRNAGLLSPMYSVVVRDPAASLDGPAVDGHPRETPPNPRPATPTLVATWVGVFSRRPPDGFTPRQATMLQWLHSYISFALEESSPAEGLTPVQKQTLEALLGGDSEKAIATALGRSPHTVHSHVKAIYRIFGVNSRAELLARFVDRG